MRCGAPWNHVGIRAVFQGKAFFDQMQQALADEYLVRCLTPNRSGHIKTRSQHDRHDGLFPSIFKAQIRRSDPRAVNAMAKYAVAKNLVFHGSLSLTLSLSFTLSLSLTLWHSLARAA